MYGHFLFMPKLFSLTVLVTLFVSFVVQIMLEPKIFVRFKWIVSSQCQSHKNVRGSFIFRINKAISLIQLSIVLFRILGNQFLSSFYWLICYDEVANLPTLSLFILPFNIPYNAKVYLINERSQNSLIKTW